MLAARVRCVMYGLAVAIRVPNGSGPHAAGHRCRATRNRLLAGSALHAV
jgi:hypothetical protein